MGRCRLTRQKMEKSVLDGKGGKALHRLLGSMVYRRAETWRPRGMGVTT